jgi:hypothetical protein
LNNDIKLQIGELILNSGSAEVSIRSAILVLTNTDREIIRALLQPRNMVSKNLDILLRVVHVKVHEECRSTWIELIASFRDLFTFRNQIAHGMPGMNGSNEFLVCGVKSGKKGSSDLWDETIITLEEITKINIDFSSRNRQVMDFIEGPNIKSQYEFGTLLVDNA